MNKEQAPQYAMGALILILALAYLYVASLHPVDPRGNPDFIPEPNYIRPTSTPMYEGVEVQVRRCVEVQEDQYACTVDESIFNAIQGSLRALGE